MSYEDLVVFENELNDDIPPEYGKEQKEHDISSLYDDYNNHYNVRSLYDYSDDENLYDVDSSKVHKFKKTSYDIKSKESDFKICEELFQVNREEEIFNDLMKIYENPNEHKAEFTEIKFDMDLLPLTLTRFNHITELVVKKCKLDVVNVLPPKIEKVIFNNCGLKYISCQSFPNSLTHIDFCNNDIEIFDNIKKTITHLYLDNNNLQYIHDIPEDSNLKVLSLKNNKFKSIDFLVDINLIELNISNNFIENIDVLSNTIETLEMSKNNIFTIGVLPENLKILIAYNCKINKFLFELPYFLEKLDLYNNNLEELPEFNKLLKWLDISSNDFRKLPNNILQLDYCDISCNSNLVFDPTDTNWISFLDSKNKTYIMDKQDDYILKSDTISTISTDSDTSEDTDDGVTVDSNDSADSADSVDIEEFKIKITKPNNKQQEDISINIVNTDSDKLDEEFYKGETPWTEMINSIEDKQTDDEIVKSLLSGLNNNNTLQNSVTQVINSFQPKEKRIVKTLKTFTM